MRPLTDGSITNQEHKGNITVTLKRLRHLNNVIFSYVDINISDQLQTTQISLVGPKILQYHQEMTQLTPLSNLPFSKV